MKRIIFFSKSLQIGGLERALVNLLNALAAHFDVTLVLESVSGELLDKLDRRIHIQQYSLCTCRVVLIRKAVNLTKRMLWMLKNRNKFDFSCSYCTYSVIGSRLALYASKNSCLYVHSDYSLTMPGGEYEALYRQLRAEAFAKLFFISNECKSAFLLRFPELAERSCTVNNLTDTEEILRLSEENAPVPFDGDKTVFAFVGRLEEETKRITRLLEAFSLARRERDDIRLVIVGGGRDEALCRSLICRYALEKDVFMAGSVKNPYPYIKRADCLVISSDQEGFPMVYYEAMALHTAVMTTVPVSDEAVDMREHAIVTEKNATSLAAAMTAFEKGSVPAPNVAEINRQREERILSLLSGTDR